MNKLLLYAIAADTFLCVLLLHTILRIGSADVKWLNTAGNILPFALSLSPCIVFLFVFVSLSALSVVPCSHALLHLFIRFLLQISSQTFCRCFSLHTFYCFISILGSVLLITWMVTAKFYLAIVVSSSSDFVPHISCLFRDAVVDIWFQLILISCISLLRCFSVYGVLNFFYSS